MMNGLGAKAIFVRLLFKSHIYFLIKLLLTMGVNNDNIYQMFCTQHIMRPLRCKYMQKNIENFIIIFT